MRIGDPGVIPRDPKAWKDGNGWGFSSEKRPLSPLSPEERRVLAEERRRSYEEIRHTLSGGGQ